MRPFGMAMPGRTWKAREADGYRYGFNGQEEDNEYNGEGGFIDFGGRGFDCKIARWTEIDVYSSKFPFSSPYAFAGNSPIYLIDVDGNYQYPADKAKQHADDYPRLTQFLSKGGIQDYLKNSQVRDLLKVTGFLTDEQINNKLAKWGEGSVIVEVFDFKETTEELEAGRIVNGYTSRNTSYSDPNYIQLDMGLINQFEKATSKEDREAALLGIVSTLLHESTHYGTNSTNPTPIPSSPILNRFEAGRYYRKRVGREQVEFYDSMTKDFEGINDLKIGSLQETGRAFESALYHGNDNYSAGSLIKQGPNSNLKQLVSDLKSRGQEALIPKEK